MIVRKLGQAGGGRFPAAGYNENKVLEGVADLLLAKNVDEDFLNHLEVLHAIRVNARTGKICQGFHGENGVWQAALLHLLSP